MRVYLKSEEEKVGSFYKNGEEYFLDMAGYQGPVYFKSVAGKNFYSLDQKKWKTLVTLASHQNFFYLNDKKIDVYLGFKPSGLGNDDGGSLISQMPGKVIKVLVEAGQDVQKGETLLILEAMKMENEVKASRDGKIGSINITEGQSIETGTLMLELEDISQ